MKQLFLPLMILVLFSNSTNAQFAANAFAPKISFPTMSGPQGMEVSDLNNDGKNEILVGNVTGNTLSVFVNNSTAGSINSNSFITSFHLPTLGNNPALISCPDFDGDGKKDILLGYAKNTGNQFSIYLNKYNGINFDTSSFTRFDFTAGTKPEGMASGDFDQDGKIDIAVCNNVSNNLYVFKNTSVAGTVSLAAPIIYPVGSAPDATAVGDIDNDGKPDIAVSNWSSNTITVYRNTSSSSGISFSVVGSINTLNTQNGPYWIKIVDFNNDGLKEVVCSNWGSGSVSIFSDTSTTGIAFAPRIDISLSPAPYVQGTAIADYDHDGFLDLGVSLVNNDSIAVFKNNGAKGPVSAATFSAKTRYASGISPVGAISSDLDMDLRPDLIVTNYNPATISILKNQILFAEPTIQTSSLTIVRNGTSATLNFTKGNGNRRIVIAKANSMVDAYPKDTGFYTASTVFGSGFGLGNNNFVVYADTGSSVTLSGLDTLTYYFSIMEYNGIGGYSNYLLTNPLNGSSSVGLNENVFSHFNLEVYPNPFTHNTNIGFELKHNSIIRITTSDLLGRAIKSNTFGQLQTGKHNINLDESYFGISGTYLITIELDDFIIHKTLIKQ